MEALQLACWRERGQRLTLCLGHRLDSRLSLAARHQVKGVGGGRWEVECSMGLIARKQTAHKMLSRCGGSRTKHTAPPRRRRSSCRECVRRDQNEDSGPVPSSRPCSGVPLQRWQSASNHCGAISISARREIPANRRCMQTPRAESTFWPERSQGCV